MADNTEVIGAAIEKSTKETIAKADVALKALSPDRWIELVFQRGPLATLAAGGAVAFFRGLFPSYDPKEAMFGAAILLATSIVELLVWSVKRRSAERAVERAYKLREAADSSYREAEAHLDRANQEGPRVTAEDLVPRQPHK